MARELPSSMMPSPSRPAKSATLLKCGAESGTAPSKCIRERPCSHATTATRPCSPPWWKSLEVSWPENPDPAGDPALDRATASQVAQQAWTSKSPLSRYHPGASAGRADTLWTKPARSRACAWKRNLALKRLLCDGKSRSRSRARGESNAIRTNSRKGSAVPQAAGKHSIGPRAAAWL